MSFQVQVGSLISSLLPEGAQTHSSGMEKGSTTVMGLEEASLVGLTN